MSEWNLKSASLHILVFLSGASQATHRLGHPYRANRRREHRGAQPGTENKPSERDTGNTNTSLQWDVLDLKEELLIWIYVELQT